MATIEDVAREAGVAISTVSYALSGKRKLSPETRQRVIAAAQRLGYVPSASARALAAKRSRIIAVSTPRHAHTDEPAYMAFALAVTVAAHEGGYDSLLLVDEDPLAGVRRVADAALVDGVIVLDVAMRDSRAALARNLRIPTVFVGLPDNTEGLACVDIDAAAAMGRALELLAGAGHRRVVLVGQPDSIIEREFNYALRLERAFASHAARLGLVSALVRPASNDAGAVCDDVQAALPEVTAIVLATSYEVALAMGPCLASRGRAVPESMSVVVVGMTPVPGLRELPFDSFPLHAALTCPSAVELLLSLIDGAPLPDEPVLVPPPYVERGTVAKAVQS